MGGGKGGKGGGGSMGGGGGGGGGGAVVLGTISNILRDEPGIRGLAASFNRRSQSRWRSLVKVEDVVGSMGGRRVPLYTGRRSLEK